MKYLLPLLFVAQLAVHHVKIQRLADRQAVQIKLLSKQVQNERWHVQRSWEIRPETDRLRWYWKQTQLWHTEWARIVEQIYFWSTLYDIRPELTMSVAHRESYFDPQAKSPVACGLFQINYAVWKDALRLDEDSVLQIDKNIQCGIWILKQYLVACNGDEIRALNMYWSGSPIPPHDGYVKRIFSSPFMGGMK